MLSHGSNFFFILGKASVHHLCLQESHCVYILIRFILSSRVQNESYFTFSLVSLSFLTSVLFDMMLSTVLDQPFMWNPVIVF